VLSPSRLMEFDERPWDVDRSPSFDCCHPSLRGRFDSPAGWTELRGWGGEQTVWLRWCFTEVERLNDMENAGAWRVSETAERGGGRCRGAAR